MRKQIWLLAVSLVGAMASSLFLAGCGGGGKKITQNPADPPPPAPTPTVNVPAGMKGVIVFRAMGKEDFATLYALSAGKQLEKVDEKAWRVGDLSFSPNGQYLVYGKATGENITLPDGYRAVIDTVVVNRSWSQVASFRDQSGIYSWSSSGRYLMFGCRSEGIYAVHTTSWEITKLVASDGGDWLLSPGMSPDESVLVWTRYKEGEDVTIFRSPMSGRLTVTILEVVFATASRRLQDTVNLFLDSRQMVYTVDDRVLLGEIGSNQSWQIANLPSLTAVKLSPNKEKLACLTVDGLYVYSTASWQEQMVVGNPSRSNSALAWSPDGAAIAILEENSASTDLALYGLADGAKKVLVSVPTPDRGRTLSPFGQLSIDWAS